MDGNFFGIKEFSDFNFDEMESQNQLGYCENSAPEKTCANTGLNQSDSLPCEHLATRSTKKKVDAIQISFEDNFLSEHQKTFKNTVQKYIESVFPQKDIDLKKFLSQELFPSQDLTLPSSDPLHSAIDYNSHFSFDERIQFTEDLKHEDMLEKFLTFVCSQCFEEVGREFAFLGSKVWDRYIQIRMSYDDQDDLIKYGESFVNENIDKLINSEHVSFLTFKKSEQLIESHERLEFKDKVRNHFKYFLTVFVNTCFLIIDGYFANPYFAPFGAAPKRSHGAQENSQTSFASFFLNSSQNSQSQEEYSGRPQKKRKL